MELDRDPASPANESRIAVIGDVVAFLRMSDFFSDLLRRLTRPGCGPRLVHGDGYRGDRSAIHACKTDQLATRIGHRYHDSFLHLRSLFNDQLDHLFRLGVVDGWNGFHGWKISRGWP